MLLLLGILFMSLDFSNVNGKELNIEKADNNITDTKRNYKQFSLFTIVSFPNDACKTTGASTGIDYGTCLSSTECNSESGTAYGNCASGFGVCCAFKKSSCSSSLSKNCSYIQNPGYSSSYTTTGSCSYSLTPTSDICQLRFDFNSVSLGISTTGKCSDSFAVTGATLGSNATPSLCGTLTGDHLYVENARSTSTVTIAFTIASTTGVTWSIKVSQIECSSKMRAPTDCHQYLTGVSGLVKSFNRGGGVPIMSQRHSYCIRQEAGMCKIQYSVNSGITSPDPFLVNNIQLKGLDNLATATLGFLTIPNSKGVTNTAFKLLTTQLQGGIIGAIDTIVTATAPFRLYHVTSNKDQSPAEGFNLQYHQMACGSYDLPYGAGAIAYGY